MKVTISGFPGSGKTTIGELLSEEYGIPFFSVGDLRGEYAKTRGMTIEELNELGKKDESTDKDADKYQAEWAQEKQHFALDGRLSYFFIPDSIKIFLAVSPEVGAIRIFQDPRKDEKKYETVEEVQEANQKRCRNDMERYAKIYGIKNCYDETNFDIVIDTTDKNPQQVLELIKQNIRDYFLKKINQSIS